MDIIEIIKNMLSHSKNAIEDIKNLNYAILKLKETIELQQKQIVALLEHNNSLLYRVLKVEEVLIAKGFAQREKIDPKTLN